MEVLVCAGWISPIQKRPSCTGSERKLVNSMTHHSSQWQVSSKRGENPLIISPKTIYTVQKWLRGLAKKDSVMAQKGSSIVQSGFHWEVLRQLNMTASNCNELVKIKLVNQEARKKCCSHSWHDLNERQDTEYTPTPRSTWYILVRKRRYIVYIQIRFSWGKVGGSSNFGKFGQTILTWATLNCVILDWFIKQHIALFGVSAYLAYGLDFVAKY